MTIRSDLDAAIDPILRKGEGDRARIRMGPSAFRAMGFDDNLVTGSYRGIRIERVEAPSGGGTEASADRFHGWELIP